MICKRVCFHGDVQGVGFRYTTIRVAESYTITGYVKNMADGTVELVALGKPDDVDAFIDAVGAAMAQHIREIKVREEPAYRQKYDSFSIRY